MFKRFNFFKISLLLVGLVMGLVYFSNRAQKTPTPNLIERISYAIVSPFSKGLQQVMDNIKKIFGDYPDLENL